MERQSAKESKPGFLSILSGEWIDVPESDRVSLSKFELKLMLTSLRLHAHFTSFDYAYIWLIMYDLVINYLKILNIIFQNFKNSLSSVICINMYDWYILSTDIIYVYEYIHIHRYHINSYPKIQVPLDKVL